MTQKQISDLLGCPKTRVYRFILKNEIVATRSNGTTQYYSEEISKHIIDELGAILESERAMGKIDRKRAGLSEEYGSANDYVLQNNTKHSPISNDLSQNNSERFNANQNISGQFIANQTVSSQIAAEQSVSEHNASNQSGSIQNDAPQQRNPIASAISEYSKAVQSGSGALHQNAAEQRPANQSVANQSEAGQSILNYGESSENVPIQNDTEQVVSVQSDSARNAAEQSKANQSAANQSEAEQNMAEIMEHMIQSQHGAVQGKVFQSASGHCEAMQAESEDVRSLDGLYHIKAYWDGTDHSDAGEEDAQALDMSKNASIDAEHTKTDQNVSQQGSNTNCSASMQSDSDTLIAVLQNQMTEFRRIMEMQLVTKDNQIAEKDKQLESLTKALAAAQEQLTETTVALRAAQALHAGTMQEHLIETDAEKQETEHGGEKQGFWSKLFHKKI